MRIDWGVIGLLLFFLIGIIAQSSQASSPITSFKDTKVINVINQTYIDSYFTWRFAEINSTAFNASLEADQELWANVNICRASDNPSCWIGLCSTWFSNIINCSSATQRQTLRRDFLNISNYPLLNLTNNIRFSNFSFNISAGTASFIINFPNNFTTGERARFGFGSTSINSALGDTQPWQSAGRTICRTSTTVHAVAVNGTQIDYWNSTDGITWSEKYQLDGSSSNDNVLAAGTTTIACSGNNVFVGWMGTYNTDGTTRTSIYYRNSSDQGATWNSLIGGTRATVLVNGTAIADAGIILGNCMFGTGDNIWCAYQWDSGTPEDIWVLNMSSYGGDKPTLTTKDMGVDITSTLYQPMLFVNMSSGTEQIFVGTYYNAITRFNYSLNGGSTWSAGGNLSAQGYAGHYQMVIMNNTIWVVLRSTNIDNPNLYNSTDAGITWGSGIPLSEGVSTTKYYPTIATDNYTNLFIFWSNGTTGTAINDVVYNQYNISSGWKGATLWQNTNSNISTMPNCNWYNQSARIECLFINASEGTSPISLQYDYIETEGSGGGGYETYNQSVNDSLTYAELITRWINISRALNDSLTYAESLTKQISLIRSFSDSLTYEESETHGLIFLRTLTSFMSYGEAITDTQALTRSFTDSLEYAESITKQIDLSRTVTSSLTYAESAVRQINLSRSVSSFLTYAEDEINSLVFTKTLTSFLTYDELVEEQHTLVRSLSDSLEYADSMARQLGLTISVSSYLTYAEDVDYSKITSLVTKYLYDSFAYAESAVKQLTLTRTVTSYLTYAESVTRQLDITRTVTSSLTYAESVLKSGIFSRAMYDSLAYSEGITKQFKAIRSVSDHLHYYEYVPPWITFNALENLMFINAGFMGGDTSMIGVIIVAIMSAIFAYFSINQKATEWKLMFFVMSLGLMYVTLILAIEDMGTGNQVMTSSTFNNATNTYSFTYGNVTDTTPQQGTLAALLTPIGAVIFLILAITVLELGIGLWTYIGKLR